MSWVRLRKENDWGMIYYIDPSGARVALPAEVDVRFPDGFECRCDVHGEAYVHDVPDHGHTYKVNGRLYGIVASVHGINVWIDMSEVEVRL